MLQIGLPRLLSPASTDWLVLPDVQRSPCANVHDVPASTLGSDMTHLSGSQIAAKVYRVFRTPHPLQNPPYTSADLRVADAILELLHGGK